MYMQDEHTFRIHVNVYHPTLCVYNVYISFSYTRKQFVYMCTSPDSPICIKQNTARNIFTPNKCCVSRNGAHTAQFCSNLSQKDDQRLAMNTAFSVYTIYVIRYKCTHTHSPATTTTKNGNVRKH